MDLTTQSDGNGKLIYLPLFAPGVHKMKLGDLENKFIVPFVDKHTRSHLCNRFRALLYELAQYKLDLTIWIDGSFCSNKPNPDDIDMVIFLDLTQVESLSREIQSKLFTTLNNRDEIQARYSCDLYFEDKLDKKQYHYWKGYLSYDQLNRPKGFIQITVNHDEHCFS